MEQEYHIKYENKMLLKHTTGRCDNKYVPTDKTTQQCELPSSPPTSLDISRLSLGQIKLKTIIAGGLGSSAQSSEQI